MSAMGVLRQLGQTTKATLRAITAPFGPQQSMTLVLFWGKRFEPAH